MDYTDHLGDVLDDGMLVEAPAIVGAAHGLSVSGLEDRRFTVTGDQAAKSMTKVTYAVRVHDTGRGDGSLTNYLTEGDTEPPATCVDTTPTPCTHHPIDPRRDPPGDEPKKPGGRLPNTGGPTSAILLTGLLALGGGLLLMRKRRRERRN